LLSNQSVAVPSVTPKALEVSSFVGLLLCLASVHVCRLLLEEHCRTMGDRMQARSCIPRAGLEPTPRLSRAKHIGLPEAPRMIGLSEVLMTAACRMPAAQTPMFRSAARDVRFCVAGGVDP
jgi:hypothetical protein